MTTPKKRQQKSIDIETKKAILVDVDKSELSKTKISKKYNIAKSTLSTIIKNREKILTSSLYSSKSKRMRRAKYENVESELLEWFKQMRASNFPLSGPIIQEKAREISVNFGIENFDCSSGWLWRFQKRHGISSLEMSHEAVKVVVAPEVQLVEEPATSSDEGESEDVIIKPTREEMQEALQILYRFSVTNNVSESFNFHLECIKTELKL